MDPKPKTELKNSFRDNRLSKSNPGKPEIQPMVSLCDMQVGWTVMINGIPFTIKQHHNRRRVTLIEYKPQEPKRVN